MSELQEIAVTSKVAVAEKQNAFLRKVFGWMFTGLALTTAIALWFHLSTNAAEYFAQHGMLVFALMGAQLAVVFVLSGAINRLNTQVAVFLFFFYAGLTGVTFSVILAAYSTTSIVSAFAGAAGVFGGMAMYGYATQRDLSGWGGVLFGALIGLIVASFVFIFIPGTLFNLILGFAGVIIFAGLTAYDMQNLKKMAIGQTGDEAVMQKASIIGALSLYLNFINLFLSLLRIFGRD